jgi:hypothetical protein
MAWTSIVFFKDWMMDDCCSHGVANSKQQTANSQTSSQWSAVSAQKLEATQGSTF